MKFKTDKIFKKLITKQKIMTKNKKIILTIAIIVTAIVPAFAAT